MAIYSQWRSEFCDPTNPGNALLTWPVTWLSAVNKNYFIYKCILIIVLNVFKNTYVKCIIIIIPSILLFKAL